MSKIKYYSFVDMAKELNLNHETIRKRLKKANCTWTKRVNGVHYFSEKAFDKIRTNEFVLLYQPVYITTTYHIYESKINTKAHRQEHN